MRVTDLNRDQLIQVKEQYLVEREQRTGVSWAELANADELVSDEEIMKEYSGMYFSEDDFAKAEEGHEKLYCPKCGKELKEETEATISDYPLVCENCDENFYGFEAERII